MEEEDKNIHLLSSEGKVVDYSKVEDEEERFKKAIADIIDYVGINEFLRIHYICMKGDEGDPSRPSQMEWRRGIAVACSISGYPAIAWYDMIYGLGSWKDQGLLDEKKREEDRVRKEEP